MRKFMVIYKKELESDKKVTYSADSLQEFKPEVKHFIESGYFAEIFELVECGVTWNEDFKLD